MSPTSLNTILVEKQGMLKEVLIKNFSLENLHKKCGFKSAENFKEQVQWKLTVANIKYVVKIYGKSVGRANNENKYEFPPPIDKTLLFGNCIIVVYSVQGVPETLTLSVWEKLYESLFGGFEDLKEEEDEVDELDNIPKEKKTKDGYLKDDFVVDSDSDNENESDHGDDNEVTDVEVGSELSEEEYIVD
tara:strand:- start:639 stop:1205 length:567 start_codon:yes stop_codon:yes gene_type:complete